MPALDLGPKPLPSPPPGFLVRFLLGARRWLVRVADRLIPAELIIFERVVGFGETVLLREVARLGVADALQAGPRDAASLAKEFGVQEDVLHRSLRALAQRGVFTLSRDGRFSNSRLSQALFRGRGTMHSFVDYIGDRHNLLAWDRLDQVLREGGDGFTRAHGEGVWTWYEKNPVAHARFASMMADRTLDDASAVAAYYPFPSGITVCDVGGGIGIQLSEILVRHPSLRGVLFDSPRTLGSASEPLQQRGVLGRVRLERGSFFEEVPAGADLYLLKNVLHDWGDEQCLRILERVRQGMKPGARLLIAESLVARNDEAHPAVLADVHMLMLCEGGRERSAEEFRSLLHRARFKVTRVIYTPVFLGLVEAEVVE